MTTVNVNFSDSTETVVQAYFSNAQDPEQYPNQGELDTSDPRWKAFYDESPLQSYLPVPTA